LIKESLIVFVKNILHYPHYIMPYVDYLSKHYDVIIIHNSLNEGISQKSIYNISLGNIYAYDESINPINTIINMIAEEKKVIASLIINFRSLWDIHVIRTMNHLNIPVIFINHGILDSTSLYYRNIKRMSFRRYMSYAKYIISGTRNMNVNLIDELYAHFKILIQNKYHLLDIESFLLYSPHIYDLLQRDFKIKDHRFIGIPVLHEDNEFNALEKSQSKIQQSKYAVYIHQNFIENGYSNISLEEELNFIEGMSQQLLDMGYSLVVKPHPSVKTDSMMLIDNVQIMENNKYEAQLVIRHADIVIGHYSTLLLSGIAYKKPIIILKYPGLTEIIKIENTLMGKLNIPIIEVEQLQDEILNLHKYDVDYTEFIRYYIHSLTTYEQQSNTLKRVIENVSKDYASSVLFDH
jgi:hypothetical protein